MSWFESESNLDDPEGKIYRRAYGTIEVRDGIFQEIRFKPWPRIITTIEINSWGRRTHEEGAESDHCVLYYNQPFFHKNFLALKYIVSNRGTSVRSVRMATTVLDLVAKIKGSDAIVCEVSNHRIPDRLLERWGWEAHLYETPGRHFIRRFYGSYPDVDGLLISKREATRKIEHNQPSSVS